MRHTFMPYILAYKLLLQVTFRLMMDKLHDNIFKTICHTVVKERQKLKYFIKPTLDLNIWSTKEIHSKEGQSRW
jgi:hypothetical protein